VIRKFGAAMAFAVVTTLVPLAGAAEESYDARAAIVRLFHEYSAHGAFSLPSLTEGEIEELLAGKAVIKDSMDESEDSDGEVGEMGIAGMQLLDAPRLLVWLAAMGVASEPDIRLTRAFLEHRDEGAYVRYQHVNLPWPIRDRHWVILCEKNVALASASNGSIWEHKWSLVSDGETLWRAARQDGRIAGLELEDMERSIYLAENRGAWIMLEVEPGKTLVIAFFDGDLGGRLPKMLVRRFSHMQLRNGLQLVGELSAGIRQHYDDSRPVHDGFGRPIEKEAVLNTALARDNGVRIAAVN
jgi:hypothetical protein